MSIRLYGTPMVATVKVIDTKGYYVETSKKDISRRTIPITLFLKEDKIQKIVVKEDD